MGGIYIKGMKMPTAGLYIVSVDNTNGQDKTVATVERMLCIRDIHQIVGIFELVPIPPHGRLGDLDELHKEAVRRSEKAGTHDIWYNCADRVICALDIKNAPTIIPAEPEEEEMK